MTRINAAIPVERLPKKLLLAEHREIIRIPNCVKKGRYNLDNIPSSFKLGTGHVKFFYIRLKYLHDRYEQIYAECKKRDCNVQYYGDSFGGLPKELYNDWIPEDWVFNVLKNRIKERGFNLL